MATCEYCAKKALFGHNISHSHRVTNRQFKPNVQRVRVMEKGHLVTRYLCARCIKTLNKNVVK